MDYETFLKSKRIVAPTSGRSVDVAQINPVLWDFQRDITVWALNRGCAAVFADCGLGKSLIQLEYARLVGGTTLIVAPLAVSDQTIRIGCDLLSIDVHRVDDASELQLGINITNYEMLKHFGDATLDGVVLDESSIVKSIDGKTRGWLLSHFRDVPFRLCCTATPCPNDVAELANHAEFLGIMKRVEMLASFFVHDDEGWRLRGHAKQPFYRWLASWAMALRSPEDLGYDGSRFQLPPLNVIEDVVTTDWRRDGELFPGQLKGITDRIKVRKASVSDRVARAAEIVSTADGQCVVWCGLNPESSTLAALIPDAVEISGADSREAKREKLLRFINGDARVLVTKGKVAGFGLNLQNASTMIFVGLGDSYELYYQCIRRCWRYGQQRPVNCYVVVTDHERQIVDNVRRKEIEATTLMRDLINAAKEYEMEELHRSQSEHVNDFTSHTWTGDGWEMRLGDCVEELRTLPDDSIDLSVFSPPFSSLYTYSATERDIGNTSSDEEFFMHFRFVIGALLKVTKPGRICAVHVADVPAMLVRDGYIGLKDFSGNVIRAFIGCGWTFDARVPIDKNQQAQSIRTHAKGLTMTQMEKDRTWSRPALPDYILKFRKPGENKVPVKDGLERDTWIEWANPTWPGANGDRAADAGAFATWYGISESDTLNVAEGRGSDDDRHICALQLGTIERIIRLWSNEGELVCSPFAGIGSEGYEALRLGRRFWGAELKPRYAEVAVRNLKRVTTRAVSEPMLPGLSRVA